MDDEGAGRRADSRSGEMLAFDLAEQSGAIHGIGDFMLTEGRRYAGELAERGRAVRVTVNVSARQLASPAFFDLAVRLAGELRSADGPVGAAAVTLEITESEAIADLAATAGRLRLLHGIGYGVSLDDVGVGHHSVVRLDALPLTEIKIDRSILRVPAPGVDLLLGSLVRRGLDRGLRVVVEGIETTDDLERVRRSGAGFGQGFLLGRPMPPSTLDELLALSAR